MNTKKIYKKLVRDAHAVSPIIATLMLVLVAVGSAGAFYAWQTGWQQESTQDVGSMDGKTNLVIGGSSTVLPFSAAASAMFEKEFPYAKISYSSGGSGSGITAAAAGVIDIGASSRWLRGTDPSGLIEHTVAYDAIVMIVPEANEDIDEIQIIEIQAIYYINGGATTIPQAVLDWRNGNTFDVINGEAPAGTFYVQTGDLDIVRWSHNDAEVVAFERSDVSGTEDCFRETLLQAGGGQLDALGINVNKADGNAALLAALQNEPNGISFMSFGGATGVNILDVDFGNGAVTPTKENIKRDQDDPDRYQGVRPINYLTSGQPSGLVKAFLDYVMVPRNNLDICEQVGYISLY